MIHTFDFLHPAATASSSVQNHRSPADSLICVGIVVFLLWKMIDFFASTKVDIAFLYCSSFCSWCSICCSFLKVLHLFLASSYFFFAKVGDV